MPGNSKYVVLPSWTVNCPDVHSQHLHRYLDHRHHSILRFHRWFCYKETYPVCFFVSVKLCWRLQHFNDHLWVRTRYCSLFYRSTQVWGNALICASLFKCGFFYICSPFCNFFCNLRVILRNARCTEVCYHRAMDISAT